MNDNCTCERNALLLSARKALGQPVLIVRNLHDIENAVDFLLHLRFRHIAQPESILHILTHRQMREDRVALEHHADIALMCRDVVDTPVVE